MLQQGAVVGGDFRVERELARGGMGGVWLVEQVSTGQKRALKVMHPTLVAEPRMRERFEQEARIGGRVPSEHVVEVIAAGVDAQVGIPWLAMELLHGEDLAALSARCGPLPIGELIPIFRQLCHALGAAHSVGIVHRDVKPENVFLAEVQSADASRQVKVLDFGIAKLAAEAKESGTGQIGTPLWMAPEQSDPRAPITPATDVWALGLLAFHLLTGRYYWKTANDPSAALSALFKETLMEPLVPASERALEYGVQARLPPGFDAWFASAVSREPHLRFSDAHAAFAALEGLAAGAVVSAPPRAAFTSQPAISQPTPSQPTAKKSSLVPMVIGLAALLLLGGLIVVVAGAGVFFLGASDGASSPAPPSAAPVATVAPEPTPAASAVATGSVGGKVASAARVKGAPGALDASAPLPEPEPTAQPAPSATATATVTAASGELKPLDIPGTQKKVNAVAAAAAVECAKHKTAGAASEAYTGSCGFRPDGSTSGGMSGGGGAQLCVRQKMLSITVGKYAHPQVWHVEIFPWSVTVK
ncbi:MAG: serine/threonine protein kinase [Polyangiaceae bacterium]|nr:serine/threonine protein kinase [Polyangiaceae bacterium]